MRRRTALAVLGGGFASLSGCSALGESGTATPTGTPAGSTPTPATTDDLEVVGVDAPDTVQIKVPYEFAVRVRNATDRRGVFESGLSIRIGDGEWTELGGSVAGEVPAGETRALSASMPGIAFLNTYGLRLDAVDRTWSFETVARRLAFGDAFETPRDLSVTIPGGRFASSYAGGGNETTTRTPPGGSTWVIFVVRISNPQDRDLTFPPLAAFSLHAEGETYTPRVSDPGQGIEVTGERVEFELPFLVPEDVTKGDFTVRWEPYYGDRSTAAEWSSSG